MEPCGEPKRFEGLIGSGAWALGFARGNVFDDGGVNGDDVAAGSGGGKHNCFDDDAADVVFGGGDVFHAFGDGPAIGSGLEIPLSGRKAGGGVEDIFFGGLEILDGFVFVGLG